MANIFTVVAYGRVIPVPGAVYFASVYLYFSLFVVSEFRFYHIVDIRCNYRTDVINKLLCCVS